MLPKIGNEKADAIAKAAATGDTSDYEECEKYESPSNNRLTQYWPYKTQWNNRWSRTNGQRTLIDRFKRVNPLTDLHARLGTSILPPKESLWDGKQSYLLFRGF